MKTKTTATKTTAAKTTAANDPTSKAQKALANLTPRTLELFRALVDDRGNWAGTPLWGGNVGGAPEDRGNLTQMKRWDLITTEQDTDNPEQAWVHFTAIGDAAIALLEAEDSSPPTVVDETVKPSPAKGKKTKAKESDAERHARIAEELLGFPPSKTPLKRPNAAQISQQNKAQKKATVVTASASKADQLTPEDRRTQVKAKPAKVDTRPIKSDPPADRMRMRHEAIQYAMTTIKATGKFTKKQDAAMKAHLELEFAPLYAKLKTQDKVDAYTRGILDFCYAACRVNRG